MEKYTTIRVKESDINMLRILKESMGSKALSEVIRKLAHKELSNSFAFTIDGYLPIGTKVIDKDDDIKTIEKLEARTSLGVEVVFTDGSYAMNGGGYVYRLRKVASKEEVMEEVHNG